VSLKDCEVPTYADHFFSLSLCSRFPRRRQSVAFSPLTSPKLSKSVIEISYDDRKQAFIPETCNQCGFRNSGKRLYGGCDHLDHGDRDKTTLYPHLELWFLLEFVMEQEEKKKDKHTR
jgi:hypothetical protein